MKRKCAILVAVCTAIAMTACAPKTTENTSSETTQSITEEETEMKQEGTKEETTKAEESTEAEAEKMVITGLVEEAEQNVVTLTGENKKEYKIDLTNAETKSGSQEVGEGDEIQVVFLDEETQVKKAESYQIINSAAMREMMDPIISGVIIESDSDSVTVEVEDQKNYTFSTKIAQIVTGEKGLEAGEYVEITYLGTLNQEVALRVITEEGSGDVEATYNAIGGILQSVSDSSVTIEVADGTQFTFTVGDNVVVSDYSAGEEVEITYEGSLTNGNAVVEGIE